MDLNQIKALTDELDNASKNYYQNNGIGCKMTDIEFDLKLKELQKYEKELGIIYPNSPTQRVGSDVLKEFANVKHPIPMLTIENVYNDDELEEWITKIYNNYHCKFNVSVKYDGISCELHYKNGILLEASTRGDKNIGDDITLNVKTISSVPLTLDPKFLADKDFYVRGEILLPKSRLEKINEERISNNKKPFSNTRNACSGSIKQLDSKITAKRGLIFRAWDCFLSNRDNVEDFLNSMTLKTEYLEKIGFIYDDKTQPFSVDFSDVKSQISIFKKTIDKLNLDYDYDGIVVKIENLNIQEEIGIKDSRAIEWGIARKWNEEYEVWTTLNDVEFQVGRTGVITPVGILEPVECSGVIVRNVTLHNIDFIKKFDLHLGNKIKITRSGGVIPYVLEIKHDLLMEMNGAYKKVETPSKCPVCGGEVTKDGKLLKCINPSCKAKIEGIILQFCSKECCDIKSIGENIVHDLVEKELVTKIGDFLYLGNVLSDIFQRKYLKEIWTKKLGEGYGEKSIDNIFDAIINARKNIPFEKIIAGLSIPNVGKVMSKTLCDRFKSCFGLINCTKSELISIEGIAETTANDIIEWINKEENIKTLKDIENFGWNYQILKEHNFNNEIKLLDGLKVCFSGKSFKFKGDEVETYLENNGAKCASVSKSLDYLIIGEKPGQSKVDKANSLGIKIITEEEFYNKFNLK